jgi:hypothetical protein
MYTPRRKVRQEGIVAEDVRNCTLSGFSYAVETIKRVAIWLQKPFKGQAIAF